MADIFLRNIDLMNHALVRRGPHSSSPASIGKTTLFSTLLWDDITLAGFTPTRLRQGSLPRCTSILIQVSYLFTAPPGGAPWPTVSIRDGNVATALPLVQTNGIELIPGASAMFECDEQDLDKGTFLDPTEFWAFLNSALAVRLHICYGILQ